MSLPTFLFIANTAAAVWLALRWSRRLLPAASMPERVLSALILFASLTELCLLVTGLAGYLDATWVGLLLVVGIVVELLVRRPPEQASTAEPYSPPSIWTRLAFLITALAFGYASWTIFGSGTKFGWDTLTYHGVSPAWWLQQHSLGLAPYNYQSYYPMNVELASLWFMLPFRIDAHANLAVFLWLSIILASFWVHARRLAFPPLLCAIALACFLFSPKVQARFTYFTSGDLALAAMLSAMIAFTWVPREKARPLARAFLAGLAGGLAVGMKPTAAPYVLLVALAWTARCRAGNESERRSRKRERLVVYGLGVTLMGSYWYFRNLFLTGNPLFPAEIGPFGGPLNVAARNQTALLPLLLAEWDSLEMWGRVLGKYLDRPLALGFLAVFGYGAGLWAAIRSKDPKRRSHLVLLVGCGLLFSAMFPFQPFSATANRPHAGVLYLARYVTFSFLVGLMLLPAAWSFRRAENRSLDSDGEGEFTRKPNAKWRAAIGWGLGLAILTALSLTTPWRAKATSNNLLKYKPNVAVGWKALEKLPRGSSVAAFSNDPPSHALIYPIFGRRLQLRPVELGWDCSIRRPLHERWREEPPSWWWEFEVRSEESGEELLANMRAAKVDFLLLIDDPIRPPSNVVMQRQLGLRIVATLDPRRRRFVHSHVQLWDVRDLPALNRGKKANSKGAKPDSVRK